MHWKAYIMFIEEVFLNPWYTYFEGTPYRDPQFSIFNISEFHALIVEFLETYGVEQYWSCRECKHYYYDSEWNEMTWESYGYHECNKRPQNNNLISFPFGNAPQKCFVPAFWSTSYGVKYHGRDEDEYLKDEYHEKYKGYRRS